MPNYLRLADPVQLSSKRRPGFDDDGPPFDHGQQAETLRGLLEGLESGTPGVFSQTVPDPNAAEPVTELGDIVLKITGAAPFTTTGLGNWKQRLIPLALTPDAGLFVFSNADSRRFFANLVADYGADAGGFDHPGSWRDALANIRGIELYDRADRISPDLPLPIDGGVVDVDVSLWPTSLLDRGADQLGRERVERLQALVERSDNELVHVLTTDARDPDRLLVRARVDESTLEEILDSPLVERVRGPLQADVVLNDLVRGREPNSEFVPAGAPIGIIDDLVDDANPWLDGVVVERIDLPNSSVFGDATSHGVQVASIAAWGKVSDLLGGQVPRLPHPIYAVRIAHEGPGGSPVVVGSAVEQIEAALRWLREKGVQIAVLPYADKFADNGGLLSTLSATIDQLSRELDMVVVVPSGNLSTPPEQKHWFRDYPAYLSHEDARIAAPGTAALAVTVGSVAHSENLDRSRFPYGVHIAPLRKPAPFSRVGPTSSSSSAGRQKPEFAGLGGSWGWNQDGETPIPDDPSLAAITLRAASGGRLFATAWGTSYAAPYVAHQIADIATHNEGASANLLRALTGLSGTPPLSATSPQPATYGVPHAGRVIESTAEHAICVYEGDIETDSYQLLELPIPEEFSNGSWDREVRVALAFDPPVRRTRRDYVAGRMQFDVVRNHDLNDLKRIYATQPTLEERKAGAADHPLPRRRNRLQLQPTVTTTGSDTLICRSFRSSGGWDVNDEHFYLVLTHTRSQWSASQRQSYEQQKFAVAVELIAYEQPQLNLHALAQAELRLQARARARLA